MSGRLASDLIRRTIAKSQLNSSSQATNKKDTLEEFHICRISPARTLKA
ncbi:hypothetical protein IFO70_38095 [Phormidium tenue FACHB-886]|nr:hypothetical protein [Phormidium tenue FACHB-886]